MSTWSMVDLLEAASAYRNRAPGPWSAPRRLCRSLAMGEVLEEIELRHDARRLLAADRDDGRRADAQQGEGVVERGRRIDERERRVHHLADGPLHDGRVAEGPIQQ